MLTTSVLKSLREDFGDAGFTNNLRKAIREGKLPNGREITPDDFSIRALFEATIGSVEDIFGRFDGPGFVEAMMREADGDYVGVNSTMFPSITGELIAKKVIDGYNEEQHIGDQLVTNMPSKLRSERITGFLAMGMPSEVEEGMPYPEGSFTEKYVTTDTAKKGLVIAVTEECVTFDQTGQLLMRAQQVGARVGRDREKTIVNGVQDVSSNVYRPLGTAAALYRTSAGALGDWRDSTVNELDSNDLVDWTDIDACLAIFDGMQDAASEYIDVNPTQLLVPGALRSTAKRIVGATEIRYDNLSSGVGTVTSANNVVDNYQILSSALVTAQSSSSWYLGDFKKQFVWQEIFPLQVFRQNRESDAGFSRDIIAMFKARYFGGIAAIDDKYVVKNNAAE